MPEVGSAEYAAMHGISLRRVQDAAARGVLPARRVGGRWLIDDASSHVDRPGRPLSDRSVRALQGCLSGHPAWSVGLSASERIRTEGRVAALRALPTAWEQLVLWTRAVHRPPMEFDVARSDLEDLRRDPRLVAGGISDQRVGISDAGLVEAHVLCTDLDDVRTEYLLVPPSGPANVVLHVDDEPVSEPLPLGVLLTELAHHDGARERAKVGELLRAAA